MSCTPEGCDSGSTIQGCRAARTWRSPGHEVAIFVDGCFWHRCPEHGTQPRNNRDWWQAKLDRNVARDRAKDAALADLGWTVLHVWEHEAPDDAANRVEAEVRRRMASTM